MRWKQSAGFTLLEFIIVIAITSFIVAAASSLIAQGFSAYIVSSNIADADWQGRLALERMTRDIRAIRSKSDITTANSTQFTFIDSNNNSVSYLLSGNSLTRNGNILADGVSSLNLSYYDSSGNTTAVLSSIRYITIALSINLNNTNMSFATTVYPRGLQ